MHGRESVIGKVLVAAVARLRIDNVTFLLAEGLDPNISFHGFHDENALQIAVLSNDVKVFQVLSDYGANPNLPRSVFGSALSIHVRKFFWDFSGRRYRQGFPLVQPRLFRHKRYTQDIRVGGLLLQHGANPNLHDALFGTALRAAASARPKHGLNNATIGLFLNAGADVDRSSE